MDTQLSIFDSTQNIPINEWEALLTPNDIFLSIDFLSLIETYHKDEISPNYIVLKEGNKVIGILYSQTFKLSSKKLKEYINHGNPGFNLIRLIKSQLSNFVNLKVGFLGNLFMTNEMGFKIHPNYWNKIDLNKLLSQLQGQNDNKLIMIPPFYKDYFEFSEDYFKEINIEPDMHLKIPKSWHSFEDYYDAIQSKYKKRYRKNLINSSNIKTKELNKAEIKQHAIVLHNLFDKVYNKSSFNAAKFNTKIFSDLKAFIPNTSIVGYFIGDKMIGFSSNILLNNTMYAHFVGLDYEVNHEFDLYSKMLYDKIKYAIENKVELIKFGRTASEFKSNFGAIAQSNIGYVYDSSGILLRLLSPLLKLIKEKKWYQRNPFKEENKIKDITSYESAASPKSKVFH
ncbi:MAG: hypothetical protein CND86_03425 [Bacteroidetes bacterium MED-G21]|nr:MAG: hypothetical protein CND86_03425 [Bacteroidetes bacterium MED-G21]